MSEDNDLRNLKLHKNMIRQAITTLLLAGAAAGAQAQTWTDITASCIDDPSFQRGNYDGWTLDSWWVGSTNTRTNCQEFWNGMWDFYRTVEVPEGRYRISLQGYYRPGNFSQADWQAHADGTEVIPCQLYANDDAVAMPSIYSASSDHSLGDCWHYTIGTGDSRTRLYYPNSMETGYQMFQQGHYRTSVETTVGAARRLTVGIRMDDWMNYEEGNWVLFTGWKIEWQGTEVVATAINLDATALTLAEGEERQLAWTVVPANATFKDVAFASSNNSVARVSADGLITAVAPGTATITLRMATGSSTATATCAVNVRRSGATPGSIVINEIQVANLDQYLDPSFNFGGWVELYNPTATSVSLAGITVSDNKGNTMHLDSRFGAVPAHGFRNVWFDHYSAWSPQMVRFKLDADGGTITFAASDGTVLARQQYPAATPRTSYARTTDGADTWGITDQPTPEATNSGSPFATARLAAPTFSHGGGLIATGALTLRMSKPSGSTLRYTTDGTTPTLTNGQTSTNGQLNISESTVVRARVYKEGMLASPVATRTFIFPDQAYSVPIVAITTDEEGLFGDDYGIFVQGNGNGRPGNGQDAACNWNMEWDRSVNMEFFTVDGKSVFNQEVGIEASGGWSRAWSPHSFNIKANKVYEGLNRMDYQFFPDAPYLRHKALKVRNGGNDTQCRIKDVAIQQVVRTAGLNVETQAYRPVHVFINGQFYNTMNLREPNNRNYAYTHYGIDTDEQDQWKMSPDSGYVQQSGTRAAWDNLVSLSATADNASTYEAIRQVLDIENYCNYMSVMLYIGGTDWPQNNIKGFKAWQDGKFRFVVFDTDGAFATSSPFTTFAGKQHYTFDALRGAEERYHYGTRLTDEIQFVTLFLNLLKNEQFQKQFVDQFCLVAGSVFEPTRVQQVVDALVAEVGPARGLWGPWGGDWGSPNNTANQVKNALSSNRQSSLVTALRNYLHLAAPANVVLEADVEGAALRVNGLPVPTGRFAGRLFVPATVSATPSPGYRFVGWATDNSGTMTSTEPTFDITENSIYHLTAMFEPLAAAQLAVSDARPLKVNEVSAANDIYVNDLFKKNDWIELYNTTAQPIDVAGMYLSDHADQPRKFRIQASGEASTVVPPYGFLVVWADKLVGTSQLHADFKLADDGGEVVLTAADNSWADTLYYCAHDALHTVGLYPDGGREAYVMNRPTIGTANTLTLDDTPWREPVQVIDAIDTPADAGQTRNELLYDLAGRRRGNADGLRSLPRGVYVGRGRKILR